MGTILGLIASGLIVGVLARFFYPGPVPLPFLQTILLGIVGSVLAGLPSRLRRGGRGGFPRAGWIASVIGAILVIFLYRRFG